MAYAQLRQEPTDENAAVAPAGKGGLNPAPQQNARRALGDIGNLVRHAQNNSNLGKDGQGAKKAQVLTQVNARGVLTRRAAAALGALGAAPDAVPANAAAAKAAAAWGTTKPRSGLRGRDTHLGAVDKDEILHEAKAGESLSAILERRSQAATAERKRKSGTRSPLPDIDSSDRGDPLSAAEYVQDIFDYYRRVEQMFRVAPDYMTRQSDINDKMRAILIDWLVEVHLKFKLLPETLYLTTNLIDRFLELKGVARRNLQLVGVTAMLIASKYEEIWAPEVKDFVYISDHAYTKEQILGMEKLMLNALRFSLTIPTSYKFLSRYLKAAGWFGDKQMALYSSYLVELALVDYTMLKYSYSMVAAAAVYVASKTLNHSKPFPASLQRHSCFTEDAIRPAAAALAALQRKAPNSNLIAVYKKYSHAKFQQIAKLPCPANVGGEADC